MKDVMLDFETLGNGKNKCVCQIGLVYFDNVTGELGQTYKANIDARSHTKYGGELDPNTVYWWLSQSKEAQNSILAEPRRDIKEVFLEVNEYLKNVKRIWSHATFDFVTLMETLKQLEIKPNFSYKTGLDLRTLSYLAGTNVSQTVRTGLHHDALDDAIHQVKYCVAGLNSVRGNKKVVNFVRGFLND